MNRGLISNRDVIGLDSGLVAGNQLLHQQRHIGGGETRPEKSTGGTGCFEAKLTSASTSAAGFSQASAKSITAWLNRE